MALLARALPSSILLCERDEGGSLSLGRPTLAPHHRGRSISGRLVASRFGHSSGVDSASRRFSAA